MPEDSANIDHRNRASPSHTAAAATEQSSNGPKRAKKACTECRQQKARCDAYTQMPCSRCKRLNVECVLSDPFRRTHKRRRLTELEKETDALRKRLGSSSTPTVGSPAEARRVSMPIGQETHPLEAALASITALNEVNEEAAASNADPGGKTLPRALNGTILDSETIDDIFGIYFKYYHQFLPILDPARRPNATYQKSPLLFWSIIIVGSRRYDKNPTLFRSLFPSIVDLALLSGRTRDHAISTIQGLLNLLTWHLPRLPGSSMQTIFPLCGTLMHAAMQTGLHLPLSTQDFSRTKIKLTEEDISRRTELWNYTVISYQRVCETMGHPPLMLMNKVIDYGLSKAVPQTQSHTMKLDLQLNRIMTRCYTALMENGLNETSAQQERTLEILLRVFEAQHKDLEAAATTGFEKIQVSIYRLSILSFHFHRQINETHTVALTNLYGAASTVIEEMEQLDEQEDIIWRGPVSYLFGLLIAGFTLLRLLKSPFAQYLDLVRARGIFFRAINMLKRFSVRGDDLAEKAEAVLTQLYNSEKVFKRPDMTVFMGLRLRNRLALSHVLDAVWWWREEYGGSGKVYPVPSSDQASTRTDPDLITTPRTNPSPFNQITPSFIPDTFAFSDENFFADLALWPGDSNALLSGFPGEDSIAWEVPTNNTAIPDFLNGDL